MNRIMTDMHRSNAGATTLQGRRGFSIVETLVYVAVLAGVSAITIPVMVALSRAERQIAAFHDINGAAVVSMERMARTIRAASSITATGSIFDVHPGALTVVETEGVLSTTTRFYVENSALMIDENGVTEGALSGSVLIDSLVFHHITTAASEGIRIELQLFNSSGAALHRATFYTTAFARGSY